MKSGQPAVILGLVFTVVAVGALGAVFVSPLTTQPPYDDAADLRDEAAGRAPDEAPTAPTPEPAPTLAPDTTVAPAADPALEPAPLVTPSPRPEPPSDPTPGPLPTPVPAPDPDPTPPPAPDRDGAVVVAAADSPDRHDAHYRCDGRDDQVQIQAAINGVGASGGRVLLLEGTFRITGTIMLYQGLTLEGSGYATLLYLEDNSDCTVISNAGGYNIARANVTVKNLRIDGNKAHQSAGHGILRSGASALYQNLWVAGCAGRGISHSYGDGTRVSNCTVRDCTGRGIFLEQSSRAQIAGNRVYHCGLLFGTQEEKAIEIYAGADNAITGNYIEGGGAMRQIGAWDTPRVEIRDNTLADGLGMGIAPRSEHALIIHNTVTNAGNNAIDTCGADDNRIEGNTISRVTRVPLGPANIENSGICVNGRRTIITNNYIELCGRAGVHIGPGNNDNQVLDNVIRNCGQQGSGQAGIWVQVWTADGLISGTIIRGNTIGDDQAVPTQDYGVWLDPAGGYIDGTLIQGNDLRGNGRAAIQMYPASRVRSATIGDNLL